MTTAEQDNYYSAWKRSDPATFDGDETLRELLRDAGDTRSHVMELAKLKGEKFRTLRKRLAADVRAGAPFTAITAAVADAIKTPRSVVWDRDTKRNMENPPTVELEVVTDGITPTPTPPAPFAPGTIPGIVGGGNGVTIGRSGTDNRPTYSPPTTGDGKQADGRGIGDEWFADAVAEPVVEVTELTNALQDALRAVRTIARTYDAVTKSPAYTESAKHAVAVQWRQLADEFTALYTRI
jgi:hypothetical protein